MSSMKRRLRRSQARRTIPDGLQRLSATALQRLRLTGDCRGGRPVGQGLVVTSAPSPLVNRFSSHFRAQIGALEVENLKSAPAIVFELAEVGPAALDALIPELNDFMARVQMLALALWMVKDNAVDTELAFSEVPLGADPSFVTSNFMAISTSTCKGTHETVSFDNDELDEVAGLLHLTLGEPLLLSDPANVPHVGRIGRAAYLVQAARANRELALKIGFYIAALEALFSTTSAELSHKLSERVAYFTAASTAERISVYSGMKDAYAIRSAAMHGDVPSKKLKRGLADHAALCDHLARTALRTVLRDEYLRSIFDSSEKLESYMQRLTLGSERPPLLKSDDVA